MYLSFSYYVFIYNIILCVIFYSHLSEKTTCVQEIIPVTPVTPVIPTILLNAHIPTVVPLSHEVPTTVEKVEKNTPSTSSKHIGRKRTLNTTTLVDNSVQPLTAAAVPQENDSNAVVVIADTKVKKNKSKKMSQALENEIVIPVLENEMEKISALAPSIKQKRAKRNSEHEAKDVPALTETLKHTSTAVSTVGKDPSPKRLRSRGKEKTLEIATSSEPTSSLKGKKKPKVG